jgi:DNA-binding response OmpR family regulator
VVTRSGQVSELTSREFALLEFLLRRAGIVVSREQLLEHVWADEQPGSPNIVDVYIGYLRRKLERPKSPRLIRTVRGEGFVLEPR